MQSIKPYHQGQLDGLCGVYAFINAVRLVCPEHINDAAAKDLFRELLEKIAKRRDFEAVWNGMCPSILWPLMHAACHYVRWEFGARVEVQPLHAGASPPGLSRTWSKLQGYLDQQGTAAIICLGGRHQHWTVARKATARSIRLVDSGNLKLLRRAWCTTDLDHKRHRVDPETVYLVSRPTKMVRLIPL